MQGNITITVEEFTRLLKMKAKIDVIEELNCIVDLKKEDILAILGIAGEDENND